MKRMIKANPRSNEYLEYLYDHCTGVSESWEMLKNKLLLENPDANYDDIDIQIMEHDDSKYDDDEFVPYCNHFYPCDGFEDDEVQFDKAWLCHQHKNPHHWQYWVLVRDSGSTVPMDMDFKYICEMVCDWHSFSLKDSESTAFNWYHKNKDNMILSDTTRKTVEKLVEFMKDPVTVEVKYK